MGNDDRTGKTYTVPVIPPRYLPKYVFVLSLENRSFDHLFGRYHVKGKDAVTKKDKYVDGVLLDNGDINPDLKNSYGDKTYGIPEKSFPDTMQSDPKHEFEHILCQTCGPEACKDLMKTFSAGPKDLKKHDPPTGFYDKGPFDGPWGPPPQQSYPLWFRKKEASGPKPPARHKQDNSGFVHSFVTSYTVNSNEKGNDVPSGAAKCANPDEVMQCLDTQTQLPTLFRLAKDYVICDNFFSSLPGPTAPNRFFMMAGSSAGYDYSPDEVPHWSIHGFVPLDKGNIFTHLKEVGVSFGVYGDDDFPMAATMEGVNLHITQRIESLQKSLNEAPDKPFPHRFVWIEPDFDVLPSKTPIFGHPMYSRGNSMHPCSGVTKGDAFVNKICTMIMNSSVWKDCVLFITWDEHGAFYDHVLSPPAAPPGDNPATGKCWGFDFKRFGTRVPCIVVSPLVESNLIDSRLYDHCSILMTVIKLYNKGAFTDTVPDHPMEPWTERIRRAASMDQLFTQDPRKGSPPNLPAVQLPATPEPDSPDQAPMDREPSGNTPTFLFAALRLHHDADPTMGTGDPTVDMAAKARTLTSDRAVAEYSVEAARAIEQFRQRQAGSDRIA